jgi:hypothetical protein
MSLFFWLSLWMLNFVIVVVVNFEGDVARSTDDETPSQGALATVWLPSASGGKNTVVGTLTYLTTTFFEIPRILTFMPQV